MLFWHRSSRTKAQLPATGALLSLAAVTFCALTATTVHAQAGEDVLSQKEIDTLRDTAFSPSDRLLAFEQFLNDREKMIQSLVAKRRGHTDYGGDLHDALDQFGQIADELNDNLDEYSKQHRDVRKVLPKLLQMTDHWTSTLASPAESGAYDIVRRIALDNVKDTHEIVTSMQTDLTAFFKAHPEAEKAEKERNGNPHAIRPE